MHEKKTFSHFRAIFVSFFVKIADENFRHLLAPVKFSWISWNFREYFLEDNFRENFHEKDISQIFAKIRRFSPNFRFSQNWKIIFVQTLVFMEFRRHEIPCFFHFSGTIPSPSPRICAEFGVTELIKVPQTYVYFMQKNSEYISHKKFRKPDPNIVITWILDRQHFQ